MQLKLLKARVVKIIDSVSVYHSPIGIKLKAKNLSLHIIALSDSQPANVLENLVDFT